ncbi:2,3,4,5-tetrahydropyridine-2,6-dicarboxylate N-succinyltransferase [bacterium endosymbiont of Pedicinus badii]|uniref:2,3,4,5-tetrahydropyridine-2,6-dicarboxylate N-succinyltransferase n=1 Tax=bacterium endosymbiont of Pedicinus badii TaxID=1719126 RepID=UPI0009BAD75F|nr:2,3,4,5-tetrahydropyridine-2,6-dicarboxylate N-succinyltransferase [bacterium endosymbiont of Pedicinus badii]OQM34003.1 2,3,4,5-tetrahydropyridine-2,6-dicarboxylate N-succinyltransferase [bacterium endosymbiont of Pedicinus badii]
METKKIEKYKNIRKDIEIIFKNRKKNFFSKKDCNTINKVINLLDEGKIRVAEKINNYWICNDWIKKAILLFFLATKSKKIEIKNVNNFFDKIPCKFLKWKEKNFLKKNIRSVPFCYIRKGAYIENNVVIMPSFINIGAFIGKGSMIDTWSTIGSCAQIGKNVHISGGVGIGGVLEPIQENPTIIEDNCFIGARSEIAEGVLIKKNCVISMGTFIGKSTKIFDRKTEKMYQGYVPKNSVVVPGTILSKTKNCQLYSAIIVKKVDVKTRKKVKINFDLRR